MPLMRVEGTGQFQVSRAPLVTVVDIGHVAYGAALPETLVGAENTATAGHLTGIWDLNNSDRTWSARSVGDPGFGVGGGQYSIEYAFLLDTKAVGEHIINIVLHPVDDSATVGNAILPDQTIQLRATVDAAPPPPPPSVDATPKLLVGDNDGNALLGNGSNDTLLGGGGKDNLQGNAGDDRLWGGADDDVINGGEGFDTMYFSGVKADYSFSDLHSGYVTVTDRVAGRDGADLFTNVEAFHFADAVSNPEIYRFYRADIGTHFFTTSVEERDYIRGHFSGTYTYEGVAAHAANPAAPDSTAVFRFFRPDIGTHFFTASAVERDVVMQTLGKFYNYEGEAFSVSTKPQEGYDAVYRFFRVDIGNHFYTADVAEKTMIETKLGALYHLDGIAYYVPHGDTTLTHTPSDTMLA